MANIKVSAEKRERLARDLYVDDNRRDAFAGAYWDRTASEEVRRTWLEKADAILAGKED